MGRHTGHSAHGAICVASALCINPQARICTLHMWKRQLGDADHAEVCRHCGSKGRAIKWLWASARSKDSLVGRDGSLLRCYVLLCVICVFFVVVVYFLRVFCAKGYPGKSLGKSTANFMFYAAGVWNINLYELHVPVPKYIRYVVWRPILQFNIVAYIFF